MPENCFPPPRHVSPNYDNPYRSVGEDLRLEGVTVSKGFDDLLDITLATNHPHLDHMIVVTSHNDRKTQMVAKKHGATCVQTDLLDRGGGPINKGFAINAGFSRFKYFGWRVALDADVAFPDNFRRILFNHTHLDKSCIYGADRVNINGRKEFEQLLDSLHKTPQASHGFLVSPRVDHPIEHRYVDLINGFVTIGFMQLYHSSCQKEYPNSLGSCQRDDVSFAAEWPHSCRRLLPTVVVYHILPEGTPNTIGLNWNGRNMPRID